MSTVETNDISIPKRARPPGAPNPHVMRKGPFTKSQLDNLEVKIILDRAKPMMVKVSQLKLDTRYQYTPEQEPNRINCLKQYLAERGGFDAVLAGAIIVSKRKDGTFFTLDGGGRSWMATAAGVERLLALIVEGLTWQEEAELFRFLNTKRRKIRDLHIFLVAANEGVEPNATIAKLVHASGYAIERTTENRKHAVLGVGSLIFAHTLGVPVLEQTLYDLRNTWGDKSGAQLDGRALVGLSPVIAAFGRRLDRKRLRTVLTSADNTFAAMIAGARGKASARVTTRSPQSRDIAPYLTYGLIGAYNRGLSQEKRLDPKDISSLQARFNDEVLYQDVWRWDV